MPRTPDVGKMNRRVKFYKPIEVSDGAGGYTKAWALYKEVWCELITKQGQETLLNGQQTNVIKKYLRCRYRTDITSDMKAVVMGYTLNVKSADDLEGRRDFITIATEQGTSI